MLPEYTAWTTENRQEAMARRHNIRGWDVKVKLYRDNKAYPYIPLYGICLGCKIGCSNIWLREDGYFR